MKTRILALALTACFFCFANKAAAIPVIYQDGEHIVKVMSLPSNSEYTIQTQSGKTLHADLGIMHKQFSLFWIPIWNYGTEKYVLYSDTKTDGYDQTYCDLTSSDIQYLQSKFAGISTKPELPFWDAYGGKLILAAVIIFIIVFDKHN